MPIVRVALLVPLPQYFDYKAEYASPEDIGRFVRVPLGRGEKCGVIVELPQHAGVAADKLKSVIEINRTYPALPRQWLELIAFVAQYYHAPPGEVMSLALPPGIRHSQMQTGVERDPYLALTEAGTVWFEKPGRLSQARSLLGLMHTAAVPLKRSQLRDQFAAMVILQCLKKGWLMPVEAPLRDRAITGALPEMTQEQQQVVTTLRAYGQKFRVWLLQGVTGSGKTEVYLRLAQDQLQQGRQMLILVPEISLTSQLEQRIAERFPAAGIVSLHSGIAEGARAAGFSRALLGQADIVLGTRLSVFVPMPGLGMIIVDEEHDASYKQQEGIRYHARDVAVWRARQLDVPVVLGSATPSLESWLNVERRRYTLLRLTQRAMAQTLPQITVVDVRRIKLDEGLSPKLCEAIAQRLHRKEQTLIFLNRRGYAPVFSCSACGWVGHCPHCSANLVVHLADRRLRCHHCGSDMAIPVHCPECGNQDMLALGRGTQRIEARLAELFPGARILRVDRDTAGTRRRWEELLQTIHQGLADIIVGTQMLAKGHDFPLLTLVGVVGADSSLYAADFRAAERLFQQLMQVSGRAGRASLTGEVLLQTEYPDHPLIRNLVRHDYDAFAGRELEQRKNTAFPPFSSQAMLRADAFELKYAERFLHHCRMLGLALQYSQIRIYDVVPMHMTRLARRERAQLLVESDSRAVLQQFLSEWLAIVRAQRIPTHLRWQIDVDPLEV